MTAKIKTAALKLMIEAHPEPVHRNTFLQSYLYSFRNRLSELRKVGINYDATLAKKSLYKFADDGSLQKAKELIK